ncbi:hypothetical protein U1Q18_051458 [Sarracenia purpurea var. burkii]
MEAAEKLKLATEQVAELQQRLSVAGGKAAHWEKAAELKAESCKTTKAKLDGALADLESLKEQHQSTSTALHQATARVEELEGIHAELKQAEHLAHQAKQELQSKFDNLLDTADKHKRACEDLSRQNEKLQTDLDAAMKENELLKKAPEALLEARAEIKTFSSRLNAALDDYQKLEAKLQEVQRNAMQAEAESALSKQQRDEALKALETGKAQIASIEETHAATLQNAKKEWQKTTRVIGDGSAEAQASEGSPARYSD